MLKFTDSSVSVTELKASFVNLALLKWHAETANSQYPPTFGTFLIEELKDAASTTPNDSAEQDDEATEPVQADEQVAEPDQLSCDHSRWLLHHPDGREICADCGKPLAG